MRKVCMLLAVVVVCCALCAVDGYAQDKAPAKGAPAQMMGRSAPGQRPMGRPAMSMLFGTVTNIDTKDPASVKLEVKSEADGKTHVVEVLPATTVTKGTDISELKKGEKVRVMARKVDDKEVAMGVMFGKMRTPPARALQSKPRGPAPGMQERPKQ